jgi:hypothetical protein
MSLITPKLFLCAFLFLLGFASCSAIDDEMDGGATRKRSSSGLHPFLRQRTGSSVKKAFPVHAPMSPPSIVSSLSAPDYDGSPSKAPGRKFIQFNFRNRADSEERRSTFTLKSVFTGIFSGISEALNAIDGLEREHEETASVAKKPTHINASAVTRGILERISQKDFYDSSDEENQEDRDDGTQSSERSIDSSDSDEEGDDEVVDEEYRDSNVTLASESEVDGLREQDNFGDQSVVYPIMSDSDLAIDHSSLISRVDNLEPDIFDDWVSIESNVILSVQAIAERQVKRIHPPVIIDFLKDIFVKLAKKILFVPSSNSIAKFDGSAAVVEHVKEDNTESVAIALPESCSVESFLEFPSEEELVKMDSYLSYEAAREVLFDDIMVEDYVGVDYSGGVDIIMPNSVDYGDIVKSFTTPEALAQLTQIDIDLKRLPRKYFEYSLERSGKVYAKVSPEELVSNIRLILMFLLTCESRCVDDAADAAPVIVDRSDCVNDVPIQYIQGFEQIVAYFAINFELEAAGPLAYRFFQVYMKDFIAPDADLKSVVISYDSLAIELVRSFFRTETGDCPRMMQTFEAFFGILARYPFSDRSATLIYFNSATTWTDLDSLMRFLLLQVPSGLRSSSVALLAAANMIYCILALDKVFSAELGSSEWSARLDSCDPEDLDYLVQRFMGEMFISFSNRIVHGKEEFPGFLRVAESLLPHLSELKAVKDEDLNEEDLNEEDLNEVDLKQVEDVKDIVIDTEI